MTPIQSLLQRDNQTPKTISTINIHGPKKNNPSEGEESHKTETKKREKTNIKVDRNKITFQVGDFVLFDGAIYKITALDTTTNICELRNYWGLDMGPILINKLSPIPLTARTARIFGEVHVDANLPASEWNAENIIHPSFGGTVTIELDGLTNNSEGTPYALSVFIEPQDDLKRIVPMYPAFFKRENSKRGESFSDGDFQTAFYGLEIKYVHELQQFCRVFLTEFDFPQF